MTMRRSWGVAYNQIAFEIGHSSGGSTLGAIYGGVPPHWIKGDGPKMSWLPANGKPAWDVLEADGASSTMSSFCYVI